MFDTWILEHRVRTLELVIASLVRVVEKLPGPTAEALHEAAGEHKVNLAAWKQMVAAHRERPAFAGDVADANQETKG